MEKSKLLYVDDEEINLSNFRIAFRDDFQVLTALSGADALDVFAENPDTAIIVVDQKMAGISGVELLTALHEIDPVPIRIILTAYSDVGDIIEAINRGRIYEYILKPWNETELRASLKKAEEKFLLFKENAGLMAELKEKNKELLKTNQRLLDEITKQQKMEKELFAKQLELAHAGRLSSLGEMASGMAHEIHQPLTVIQLAAEGVRTSPVFGDDPLLMESVSDIIAQVRRAEKIIKNVRSFARSDLGSLQMIDPCLPLANSLSFFREQFRANGIELREELAAGLPRIRTDLHKFEQIVVNFLSNARYAVSRRVGENPDCKPQVRARVFQDSGDMIVVEIKDNGTGMVPEVKERCLEPFFTTKEVGEGTGLGLSIAHGIARELGMKLEFASEPGRGSVFRLLISL